MPDDAGKHEANLRARAALVGVTLRRIDSDCWLAARWSYSRTLAEGWLSRVEGGAR